MYKKWKRIKAFGLMTFLIISILSGFLSTQDMTVQAAGENWWDTNYCYRALITINHTYIDSTIDDFPLVVRLVSNTTLYDDVQDDGDDIVFVDYYDNTTQLAHEVENFTREVWVVGIVNATIWVSMSIVYSEVDTYLWMYWDYVSATNTQDPDSIWMNYEHVWHMNNTEPLWDSASAHVAPDHINGDLGGSPSNASGQMGGSVDFEESEGDWYRFPDNTVAIGEHPFSISMWGKAEPLDAINLILFSNRNASNGIGLQVYLITGTGKLDMISAHDNAAQNETYIDGWGDGTNETHWRYYRFTGANGSGDWYTVIVDNYTWATNESFPLQGSLNTTDPQHFYMGARVVGPPAAQFWDGLIDEFRVSVVNFFNDSYDNASFYNQNETGNFLTLGQAGGQSGPSGNVCQCVETGYEYGNWSFSEHVHEGTLDEDWCYSNDSQWGIGWSDFAQLNYTLEWNNSLDSDVATFAYAFLNNSGMNRSQKLGWIHYNTSDESDENVFMGFTFNVTNSNCFDMALYGYDGQYKLFLLHWNGSNLTNINDSSLVEDTTDAYDFVMEYPDNYWEWVPWYPTGSWIKEIYNQHCGHLQTKCWGTPDIGLFDEDYLWTYEGYMSNLTNQIANCTGVAIWSPNEETYVEAQFDIVEVWQLNYTLNDSSWINISNNNHSRPHMNFPIINTLDVGNDIMEFINNTMEGNFSLDAVSAFMQNFTNNMSMESRPHTPDGTQATDQNDTVYYYSCILTNFSEWVINNFEETPGWWNPAWGSPNNVMFVWVHDAPHGVPELTTQNSIGIAFDVDNDREWDDNDRMWFWDDWGSKYEWQGTNYVTTYNISSSARTTIKDTPNNLHRYINHTQYIALIPLEYLVKEGGEPLNISDTFGLHISTHSPIGDDMVTVWQNWNETACDTYLDEDNSEDAVKEYFLNISYFGDFNNTINDTCLGRWGEGQIGATFLNQTYGYSATINITSNLTEVDYGNTSAEVNFSVNITNTGDGTINNIVINMSWLNCSCSDWNFTLNVSSESNDYNVTGNITYYNDSCYALIDIPNITSGNYIAFWLNVWVRNCTANPSGTLNITTNLTSDYIAGTDSVQIVWGLSTVALRITATTPITNVMGITNTVANLIGVVLIISAIMVILVIVNKYRDG